MLKSEYIKWFVWAILGCLGMGGFLAAIVSRETSGYVASMSFYFNFLLYIVPGMVIFFVATFVAAFKENAENTLIFLMCFVLLPLSYFGTLKAIEFAGFARYKYPGANEMRPFGSENKERIVIEIKKNTPQEAVHKFDEEILRKSVSSKDGVSLDFDDGICGIWYPDTQSGKKIIHVPFCDEATKEQKSEVRRRVKNSTIVQKIHENMKFEEIERL